MKVQGDLGSPPAVGLQPARAVEAERLAVDLLAGAGCVGAANGAKLAAAASAALWDFLLFRGWVFRERRARQGDAAPGRAEGSEPILDVCVAVRSEHLEGARANEP